MIIDAHCHAGLGDGLTGPWDTAAPLGDYLRHCAAAGIRRSVVFSAFHSDYAAANRIVARLVARHPDRLFGFAFVHAARDRRQVRAMVREVVQGHGFVGIKVHRHDARITREVCEAAREFRLPVLYDIAGEVAVCKLLFGADGAWLHPAVEMSKVRLLRLPPQQETLEFGGNFMQPIGRVNDGRAGLRAESEEPCR